MWPHSLAAGGSAGVGKCGQMTPISTFLPPRSFLSTFVGSLVILKKLKAPTPDSFTTPCARRPHSPGRSPPWGDRWDLRASQVGWGRALAEPEPPPFPLHNPARPRHPGLPSQPQHTDRQTTARADDAGAGAQAALPRRRPAPAAGEGAPLPRLPAGGAAARPPTGGRRVAVVTGRAAAAGPPCRRGEGGGRRRGCGRAQVTVYIRGQVGRGAPVRPPLSEPAPSGIRIWHPLPSPPPPRTLRFCRAWRHRRCFVQPLPAPAAPAAVSGSPGAAGQGGAAVAGLPVGPGWGAPAGCGAGSWERTRGSEERGVVVVVVGVPHTRTRGEERYPEPEGRVWSESRGVSRGETATGKEKEFPPGE